MTDEPARPGAALPSLFVSHGPPTLVLDEIPARAALGELGRSLPRPRAVLCVSAHWQARAPSLSAAERPETIHDFYGFGPALYRIRYPAPGAPALARRAAELLEAAGLPARLDPERGLDHGAWEPLMLMYPEADVPVAQLSLVAGADAAAHLRLGSALAPLRAEGVLVLGSGTAVHNLDQWRRDPEETPDWARAFEDWLVETAAAGDAEAVAEYRTRAPHARLAHPSEEHFLPFAVALGAASGAGGDGVRGRLLHRGFAYGSLSMAAVAFDSAAQVHHMAGDTRDRATP